MQNNFIRYAATLAIICLAASGLLSVVYNVTQPKIAAQAKMEEESALKDVYPGAERFEPVAEKGSVLYYKALNASGELLGYAFKAEKKGYSSTIVTMVGMDTKGIIKRIKILSQNETPGLGSRIEEVRQKETFWDVVLKKVKIVQKPRPWFQAQFDGKDYKTLDRNVEAITGATISSLAVVVSVEEKAKEVMEKTQDGR
ncbi:MAG: FMN-binding protein [Candidatus Omnitrophica bacterium]|nr:FMN-binding protein [Candidatus Omnitrophota bacterium]MDD5138338.1 FMN-binding protein [Candidatus Omnitrophota bacterium]MDD5538191.1 FMN-binding protein [Candidatus Omnitrophota bacterium]